METSCQARRWKGELILVSALQAQLISFGVVPTGQHNVVEHLLTAHRHWLLPRALKLGSAPSVTSPRRGGCWSSASSPRRLGVPNRRSAGVNPAATPGVLLAESLIM